MRGAFRHMISERKGEHPSEFHRQIVAVYGNVMNRQNVTNWCREFSERRTDFHDEQRSGRPSFFSDDVLQESEKEKCTQIDA